LKYTAFDIDFYFNDGKNIKHLGTHQLASHYHNLFEIYYITDGTCTYFVDDKTYKLKKGDIIIIPGGIIHNTEYVNSVHSRILINCSEKYVPKTVRSKLSEMEYLYRNEYIADEIRQIFKKLSDLNRDGGEFCDDMIVSITHLFFYTIASNPNRYIHTNAKRDYIAKAIEYIKENFSSTLTLDDMAEFSGVSSEHFSRTFKKETGFNFCDYLNMLRLKKAETILTKNIGISIAEISSMCGFNDSNYFSTKFKATYGISPKKFQLENKR